MVKEGHQINDIKGHKPLIYMERKMVILLCCLRVRLMSASSIIKESISSFRKDGCLILSAAIAFFSILSLIPFLWLLVSLLGFFVGSQGEVLPKISSYITQVIPFFSAIILREVSRINLGSGVFAWMAILFMLWTGSLIFDSIEFSLKKVFNAEDLRPFWISKIISLFFVPIAGIVFIILQIFNLAIDGFIKLNNYFGITLIPLFFNGIVLKYIVPFALTFLFLSAFYAIVPPGKILFRHTMVGGLTCAVMLEVAKHIFGWVIKHNPNYGIIYGSLNTIILMLLWIFYATAIFLFCAELISAYRNHKASNLKFNPP